MRILTNWLIATAAVLVVAYVLPGVSVSSFFVAFVTAVVIGFINTFLRPLLIFLTLPLTIFSFGLFLLVINAFLIMLASALIPGFEVVNFWWALLFSLVLSIINSFLKRSTRVTRSTERDNIIIQKGE
jgi:putative membrane protein